MGTALLVVDVQPAYDNICRPIAKDVACRINNSRLPVIIYWVGHGITSDTQESVWDYLHAAGAQPRALRNARIIEKDYGFFRPFMDSAVSASTIGRISRELMNTSATTSEDLNLSGILSDDELDELPPYGALMKPCFDYDILKLFDHFKVCGGGADECLAEMEHLLYGLKKTSARLNHLVY